MEYREFYQKLENNALPNCLLLHGEEEFIKAGALEKLRETYLPEGFEVMNEAVFDGAADEGAVIEACEALPFLSEKRLVVCREHPLTTNGQGGGGDTLAEYLRAMPDSTLLIFFVRGNADMRKKLPSAIQKAGGIVVFRAAGEQDVHAFLARECKRAGKELERGAAERLVFLCGRDLTVLSREVEKVIAYAGERDSITARDVEAVATPTLEANVFQMTDALLDGNNARAVELKKALLRDGESPVMILAVLARSLRQLYHARLMLDAKKPRGEIEKAAGVSGYAAGRVLGRAGTIDKVWLEKVRELCADMDYQIKSGQIREDAALDEAMLYLLRR